MPPPTGVMALPNGIVEEFTTLRSARGIADGANQRLVGPEPASGTSVGVTQGLASQSGVAGSEDGSAYHRTEIDQIVVITGGCTQPREEEVRCAPAPWQENITNRRSGRMIVAAARPAERSGPDWRDNAEASWPLWLWTRLCSDALAVGRGAKPESTYWQQAGVQK